MVFQNNSKSENTSYLEIWKEGYESRAAPKKMEETLCHSFVYKVKFA